MATTSKAKTSTSTGRKASTKPTTQALKSTDPSTAQSTENADPTANFEGDIDVNNDIPSNKDISKAADLPVLDSDGSSHPFKSLYTETDGKPKRALIVFVRHFFCGVRLTFPSVNLIHF